MNIAKNDVQFYPTPLAFAEKILSGIDWDKIETVLDPSAGKGDLIEAIIRKRKRASYSSSKSDRNFSVDTIEIDPYLREIFKYNYEKKGKIEPLVKRRNALCEKAREKSLSDNEKSEKRMLEQEIDVFDCPVRVVHDDFMTFRSFKMYHLIVMNPPFATGDQHLLKALEMQKNGGSIICILNADTILNPYTDQRKLLTRLLEKYGAEISYYEDAFVDAERPSAVKVAVVKVSIPYNTEESDLFINMQKAIPIEINPDPELHELVGGDDIEIAVHFYNLEVAATTKLIREYYAMIPHMSMAFADPNKEGKDLRANSPMLILTTQGGSASVYDAIHINTYMKMARLKYWSALFRNEKFTGRLTSGLLQSFREKIDEMAEYEFSIFNVKQMLAEMDAQMRGNVKKEILGLFDTLTEEHSWYPECANNIHYFSGWKTNKAHMIGNKSIIPTNGMFSSYSWAHETFCVSKAYDVISDIEKTLNYLDGKRTAEVDLMEILRKAERAGQTRNIPCKYFSIDLFKKGTVHIKYNCPELIERLNIYAAQDHAWLPPNYGKVQYKDMSGEEKAVVDSFQGEKRYGEVLAKSGYYLSDPCKANSFLAISA